MPVSFVRATENDVGQRLDNYLFKHLKGVPKSRVYKMLRKGECRVNKKRVKPDYRLVLDDDIRLPPVTTSVRTTNTAEDTHWADKLKKAVLFEDDRVLVLNKPSGLAVHGGSGLSFGMIETLRAMRPDDRYLELVHRLDKETSGCILIAKKRPALLSLHRQLQESTLDKRYLALVRGNWQGKTRDVSAPLQKNTNQSGERMVRVSSEGKASLTKFETLQRFESTSLVEAYPVTGRTHQIRVHCLFESHAIMGDLKYGGNEMKGLMKKNKVDRLCLHAQKLSFKTSDDGPQIKVEAPSEDLERIIAKQ